MTPQPPIFAPILDFVPQKTAVPARYQGVWRRTLLETPQLHDTTTIVFWLQTRSWHADIRLPAGRPDFSTVRSLGDCTTAQLTWLATQQGFAGITQVDTGVSPEVCTWHRLLDYQPPATTPDAGQMRFAPSLLIETGVHASYLEHWRPLPDAQQGCAVLQRMADDGTPASPAHLLFATGDYLMQVRARTALWPVALPGVPLLPTLAAAEQTDFLDFELSFAQRDTQGQGWRILHSTLPWREGKLITLDRIPSRCLPGQRKVALDGDVGLWLVLESQPPQHDPLSGAG